MKAIVAILAVCLLAAPVSAGILDGTIDRLTLAQEFGVGVDLNDDFFQQNYKEAVYAAPRIEFNVGKGVSIYTKYANETFDVVAGADSAAEPIDVSTWAYGAMVQGDLNYSGSVIGYLELGLQKSVSPTEPDEWQFWQGLAARCYLTSAKGTAIDIGLRYKPLGDTPKVQELSPRIAFCVGL